MTGRDREPNGRSFGAIYSDCGVYRYRLWRQWAQDRHRILWIMLNPSTADHMGNNDATIERCERRSSAWGYGRMDVVNLFSYRATDPRALQSADDPVGADTDRHIIEAAARADMILCAWGNQGRQLNRARLAMTLLTGRSLSCLSVTRNGEPTHPLYLSYTLQPVPYPPG